MRENNDSRPALLEVRGVDSLHIQNRERNKYLEKQQQDKIRCTGNEVQIPLKRSISRIRMHCATAI